MTVGDKLAELLIASGVDRVFGVPGGQTLPLYEGIRKNPGKITHILMRDERSPGFAADAYARMTGKVGVCDATVGPGATNFLSPLAEAHCSSIPMLAIVSDIPRSWEHRRVRGNASQAIQQLDMFKPVSKWQVVISDPASLEDVFDHALRVAASGKPGPVVLSMPDDIGDLDLDWPNAGQRSPNAVFPRHRMAPDPAKVSEAIAALAKAKKPVLLVGGGAHISGAGEVVARLAHSLKVPLVTTITGKGIVAENDPNCFGVAGSMGSPMANEVVQQADLVFFIGSKAGQLATYGYDYPTSDTPTIHLDIDPEEIGRNLANSIGLVADVRLGVSVMLEKMTDTDSNNDWDLSALNARKQAWFKEATSVCGGEGEPLMPQAVMKVIDNRLTDKDLLVCDASLASGWAAVYLRLKTAGRNFLAPRGLAGLGWGAPAAIGAALAAGGRRVLHFAGDGGFAFSLQELEVMARLNLPVVSIIFNNDILGWIKHVQQKRYGNNFISTDFNHIDFATVAKGFNVRSYRVATLDELDRALKMESNPNGPALIDMNTDPWETPVLRNASGES